MASSFYFKLRQVPITLIFGYTLNEKMLWHMKDWLANALKEREHLFPPLKSTGLPNRSMRTRFAPSPTGELHIGHAYSALFAAYYARDNAGMFVLRIEDIDQGRARQEFEDRIFEDLDWLGLEWEEPVRRQSAHFDTYRDALESLDRQGLVYPCFCTRKEIQAEIENASRAPHGPEGEVYPGTCRNLSHEQKTKKINTGTPYAMRLDMARAIEITGPDLHWFDHGLGWIKADPAQLGDVVLARKDVPASYHLSVVVDDSLQDIPLVTRGADLLYATHLHTLLQVLMGNDLPQYYHHNLLLDENGQRFAKRNKSVTLKSLREQGYTPVNILKIMEERIQASQDA